MRYKLVKAVQKDAAWVDELTVKTMRPWVEKAWDSPEAREHYYSLNKFDPENTSIIILNGKRAGRLTVRITETCLMLDELHIDDSFRGQGLGTEIIRDVLEIAEQKQLPVELKCLKTNPVRFLYDRLGFRIKAEDEKRLYYRFETGRK